MLPPESRPQRFRFPPVNRVPAWAQKLFTLDELRLFYRAVEEAMWRRMNWFEVKDGFLVVHLPTGDIAQCGLLNVATRCAAATRAEYPVLVEAHFERCFATVAPAEKADDPLPSWEQIRPHLRMRLYADAFLGERKAHCIGRQLTDGIYAASVIDYPHMAVSLSDEMLTALCGTVEDAIAASIANCRDLKFTREDLPIDGAEAFVLMSDNHYVTSQIFHLERHLPAGHLSGALVGLPHRHNLMVYPLRPESVAMAIPAMHFVCRNVYRDFTKKEQGLALSPHLYWWHEGELTMVPVVGDLGTSHAIIVPPEFVERMLLSGALTGGGAQA